MKTALTVALSAAIAAPTGPACAAVAAWVQMTGAGAEARAITTAPTCPVVQVDGRTRPMTERAAPTGAFPNRVCVAALARGAARIEIDGQILRAPSAHPARLVILGDSGCRLKGQSFQNCNDPQGWPFGRIAALAAARKPDLVIHLGDYYYRETPCPTANAGCQGSPYGDRWATWNAELFAPAGALLTSAPWLFVRGNHEDCKRGAGGWFRQLDAAPRVKACPADSDTFAVEIGGVRLFVVDSADTDDLTAPADRVAAFAGRLAPLKSSPRGEPAWIVTHRPIWNSARLGDLLGDGYMNATERAAVQSADLAGVDLVLSGHVHNFTTVSFGAPRPSQLVVGTGGDTLDLGASPPPAAGAAKVDGLPADLFTMGRWGYFVFDRQGADWSGRFYDTQDRVAAICRLHRRALTCKAP